MNWNTLLEQAPIIALLGAVVFYGYNEIKAQNQELQKIVIENTKATITTGIIMTQVLEIVKKIEDKK